MKPAAATLSCWCRAGRNWRCAGKKVIPLLAADHRLIAVEPPALGLSLPTGCYDTQSIVALFRELVQKLDLPRFHFVGHDIGCWIGYAYASQHADTLRGATLIEAAVPGIAPGGAYAFGPEQAKKDLAFLFQLPAGTAGGTDGGTRTRSSSNGFSGIAPPGPTRFPPRRAPNISGFTRAPAPLSRR